MFQILSLSGGGILGLYSISVLAEVELSTGVRIAHHFDLIAGTSIGGILALGLAAEVPATEMQAAFDEQGWKIFGKQGAPKGPIGTAWDLWSRACRSKYSASALRDTVTAFLPPDLRLGDLKHPVIVPAINLTRGQPQLFKTPHHETFQVDLELRVVDVALATSAAPTLFPLATIGDSVYADGGLFANAPDLLALHEANQFLGATEEDVRILSVGTTTAQYSFAHPTDRRLGIWDWVKGMRLIQVVMASQQASVDSMLKHRLGDRYLRLDEIQSKEQQENLGLDVASDEARRTIKGIAQGTYQNHVNNAVLQAMLKYRSPAPRFFHGPHASVDR